KKLHLSEDALSKNSSLSRSTLRHIESHQSNVRLANIDSVAQALNLDLYLLACPSQGESDLSTVGIGFQIFQEGFSSWKIHFFNFVDEFRRTHDPRLLLLPPPSTLELKLQALIASTVRVLCDEAKIDAPSWAKKRYFLKEPWFISETENLKASALLESPLYFRENNIFVLSNFLERA
ncbi:MAG: helix-turn-helix transcriptional regulator, partial [Deltaproteobacteria bacterium]|nr:helix-turn-helix transcriptional regulator [Deltaproteobacteria bacterium]